MAMQSIENRGNREFMRPLENKVVLITGGSSGIGRAAALRMAGLGAKVCIAARNLGPLEQVSEQIRRAGGECLELIVDVAENEQCRQAVESVIDHYGKLDILVCSAGLSMRAFFEDSKLDALDRVMRVNFFGTMYMTHHALPHILRSHGSIVALSSLTGLRGVPSYSLYGASKCAIKGLYDSIRLEVKKRGVHVGVLAPGFVDTPLRDRVIGPDGQPWINPPDPPFRVWPVEKCVDLLMKMILKRRAQINLPWFMGPLFWLDDIVLRSIGNAIMRWKFPRLIPTEVSESQVRDFADTSSIR